MTLDKNTVYTLVPVFRYSGNQQTFKSKLRVKGDTLDPYSSTELKGAFTMPYLEGMDNGHLLAYGELSKRNRIIGKTEEVILTRGIATTSSLSQIGQYYLDESIPFLGLFIAYSDPNAYGMFEEGWQEFKKLLMSNSNLPFSEKAKFVSTIEGAGDISYKIQKFEGLPDFQLIKREVLPRFMNYQNQLISQTINQSELELSILSRKIRIGELEPVKLSEAAYARVIDMEPGWGEKEELLKALTTAHPSSYAFNNLGVVYLNQANRTIKTAERNLLLQNAMNAFQRSNDFFQNPYATYNLGMIYWMQDDKISAYRTFYKSMAISKSGTLRKTQEGALGAVSNYNGDYRLAAIHLNHAEKNAVNLFNQGLANFLAQDYYNALVKFEESAILDLSNGYPFYGIALVAARNGQEMMLYENLNKAVNKSEFLKKRAPIDREFFEFHEKEGFKEAIR
ncbi:MAG: hypothetical protein WD398_03605 [Cyclobacteriaceae bacterium]